jgi:branched-chain amino acid transport system substrate-binding protein
MASRRTYLKAVGVTSVAALAGCSGNGGGDGGDTGGGDTDGGDGGGDTGGTTQATTTSGSMGPEEVVIGANHPLSGSLSRAGQQMSNAAKIAAMHVNDDGGIDSLGGTQLRVVSKDNEATQELGGSIEQQLIEEDGAVACIGCYSSPVTIAATQTAERAGVPHVIDVSVADRILQDRQMNYAYRIQTPASGMAGNYVDFMPTIARENGQTMDTASLVYLDNAFGQSIRNTLRERLPDADVELVSEQAYSFGQESLDTEATQVQQADADAFIFVGYGVGGSRMMQSLQNVGYRPSLLTGTSTPTFTDSAVVRDIGQFVNNGFGNNYAFNQNLDLTQRIFADYRTEFNSPIEVTHAAMSYCAVATIAAAMEQAGSAEPEDINNALKEVTVEDHPAAMGPITFNDRGENENALSPMWQVQNLEPVVVYPEEYAQAEPQFPDGG